MSHLYLPRRLSWSRLAQRVVCEALARSCRSHAGSRASGGANTRGVAFLIVAACQEGVLAPPPDQKYELILRQRRTVQACAFFEPDEKKFD